MRTQTLSEELADLESQLLSDATLKTIGERLSEYYDCAVAVDAKSQKATIRITLGYVSDLYEVEQALKRFVPPWIRLELFGERIGPRDRFERVLSGLTQEGLSELG